MFQVYLTKNNRNRRGLTLARVAEVSNFFSAYTIAMRYLSSKGEINQTEDYTWMVIVRNKFCYTARIEYKPV